MWFFTGKSRMPSSATEALPGRAERMIVPETHAVNGNRTVPPFPAATGPRLPT